MSDVELAATSRHQRLYEQLGAHPGERDGVAGTAFAVWAPRAERVSVVGDFNNWSGRAGAMIPLADGSGVWTLFVPGAELGERYKYEIVGPDGTPALKADPLAFEAEPPPKTASVITRSEHRWGTAEQRWQAERRSQLPHQRAISIYEVHLGSWRRDPDHPERPLDYLQLADELAAYALDMGFTHVELLPVMAHPFGGSWGYQVTSYFAPTPRNGSPDDLRTFVERMHEHGVGVILDWVPAHFPRDEWALARFDGEPLYEYPGRRGEHPDWGTYVFDVGRPEVRDFLIASALYWLREFHADGLRVDAVASMLYLDYSRTGGDWEPNEFGGRENLEAVAFLRELNEVIHLAEPGVIAAAEESTAWPGVSRPTYLGGLGFGFKWNMGWMHDTLGYFREDPVNRHHHHHDLTFSLMYAFSESFILPLSHDEVVHGKGSLYRKMAGDHWQRLANLRALYAYMWAHPGKKLLFMGCELGQPSEWNADASLPWELLEHGEHAGIQALVRDLNDAYRAEPALWERDTEPAGFSWIEPNDAEANIIAFARHSVENERVLVFVANLAPVPHSAYRLGLPRAGRWRELINTDSTFYGGTDRGNLGGIRTQPISAHGQPHSAEIVLPPLAGLWLVPEPERSGAPTTQESSTNGRPRNKRAAG